MSSTSEAIGAPSEITQIVVVRHAEVHNPRDILYGRLPRFRLSRTGVQQAHVTGRFLACRPVAAIYSSPLLRARQTAQIFSGYHPQAERHISKDLLEVKTAYQGSPNSIIKPGFSFFEPLKHPCDESMEDVWTRMRRFLQSVTTRHPGATVVAVSHADPITIMRLGLLKQSMTAESLHAAVYPARASINQITIDATDPLRLTYFDPNDEGRP
ncbi:MAG: histidine phosphatase family protein [Chloroflexota bacterium]